MSTATWEINLERAEMIACDDDRNRWNLDRAWVSNWALASANQYEWAAFNEEADEHDCSEIICWRCAVGNVLKGELRTVELFTYELSDEILCEQCNDMWLGGFSLTCECCDQGVWSVPVISSEMHLWGKHHLYIEEGGATLLNADGSINNDDRETAADDEDARWVCWECLDNHYTFDLTSFTYTRKEDATCGQ